MNILFVCTGNVSRSYLAEMLLRHEIGKYQLHGIHVASAGILEYSGIPADPVMEDYLAGLNIPSGGHLSRTITKENVDWADRIFVMEKRHRDFIMAQWPESDCKIERLGKYISPEQPEDDIIDPYGKSPYHYRVVQAQIASAIKILFAKLAKDKSR
jgi:protein arginine phosphatase